MDKEKSKEKLVNGDEGAATADPEGDVNTKENDPAEGENPTVKSAESKDCKVSKADKGKAKAPAKKSSKNASKFFSVTAPTAYSGEIGGVKFASGEATTDDPMKADWFRRNGYIVE